MKVVINNSYGGFSLSPKGLRRYLELKGEQAYFYHQISYAFQGKIEFERIDNIEDVPSLFFWCTTRNHGKIIDDEPTECLYSYSIERSDPILVQVVEELGEEASGQYARLTVVEIENGKWFKINEYDGLESIQYRDIDNEWILAQ